MKYIISDSCTHIQVGFLENLVAILDVVQFHRIDELCDDGALSQSEAVAALTRLTAWLWPSDRSAPGNFKRHPRATQLWPVLLSKHNISKILSHATSEVRCADRPYTP